jgi:DNA-binding beta-propeller fold protein YncE
MVIDVSGDSNVSVANVGLRPVHAAQQSVNTVLVVNQAVTGAAADSITRLNFSYTTINSANTISLPANSAPNFVAIAPSDTLAYVTLPNYVPDPINNPGVVVPSVGVVSTASNNLVNTVPVGNNPYALAVTPDKSKLYVANLADGTISAFNTNPTDRLPTPRPPISGALTSAPIWLVARTDSQRVYVLEQGSGVLASIDTTSTAGPDNLTESPINVPGATTMTYDPNLNRLYIPGGTQMAIIDVSQSAPQLIQTIPIPQVPGVPAVNAFAVAVAALPDGSRAYVASVPQAAQPSQVNISAVQGDGTTATYTYTLTGGHDVMPGITMAVSGIAPPNDGFNGTFVVNSVANSVAGTTCDEPTAMCTFQAANATTVSQTAVTGVASSTIDNLFPQVTVVNATSNTIKATIGIPGFPDATAVGSLYYVPVCAATRFRFMMAAGGDSSRAYLSSCDGGGVNIIDTANDTYIENLPAPVSARAPIPPSGYNPPQNPVFLFAGP